MKYIYILLFHTFLFTQLLSQEDKRLALVIGNSNYEKGALKNPVNDALLMDSTLRVLGFDVILDTNIGTKTKFLEKVLEFGKLRSQYDLGLIYYAGHGVQINGYNYLLPTKEKYDSEFHVKEMGGVSVQSIMGFLQTKYLNKVSILILDACRDNPFENNWLATRSIKGKGLAKMQAPAGSLIAFSTTSGNTAPDGEGKNSLYCQKLTKNMLIEGITLPEVFQNTRTEVLEESRKLRYEQLTEETTKLTSGKFYFRKKTFKDELKLIDSLIDIEDYLPALELASAILNSNPKNKEALYMMGMIYAEQGEYEKAIEDYNLAIEYYPNCAECYRKRGYYYAFYKKPKDYEKALEDINSSIKLDSSNWKPFSNRANIYELQGKFDLALADYNKAVEVAVNDYDGYKERAIFYEEQGEYDLALLDYSKCIDIDPENATAYNNRADLYRNYIDKPELALKDYAKSIKLNNDELQTYRAINNGAIIYEIQKKYELAIKEYTKAFNLVKDSADKSLSLRNRAGVYEKQGKFDLALADYNKAVETAPK